MTEHEHERVSMVEDETVTEVSGAEHFRNVGEAVEATDVTRPDGSTRTVIGDTYVLDVPGTYVIDGERVEVR